MSQENVEIVRGIYEAWQRRDVEAGLAAFHEDVEWFGPPDISRDAGELVRGPESVRRSLTRWVSTWDDYGYELRELIECRVIRQRMFRDRVRALEAAGLQE